MNERYVWEQEIADTPFERILKRAETEVRIHAAGVGTDVTIATNQSLRGLSRLGALWMRRATARTLSDALSGLENALVGAEPRL